MIVGDLSIPFSIMDRTTIQKIKETEDLNNTVSQPDLMGTHRTLHPTAVK